MSIFMLAAALMSQTDGAARTEEMYIPTGSLIPRWETRVPAGERESLSVMRRFADCVVRTDRANASALLNTLPQSQEESGAIRAFVGEPSDCLSARRMSLSPTLLRGALAEALMRSPAGERMTGQSTDLGEYADFAARMGEADADGVDDEDRAVIVGRWLAHCMAAEHSQLVGAILQISPGSTREQEALRAAESQFSACLPQGQVLDVHRLTMRALLAEAYYLHISIGASS